MPEVMEALNEHLRFIKDQAIRATFKLSKIEPNTILWLIQDGNLSYWKGQAEGIEASIRIINSLEEKDA